jgi:hypothetical protein
MPPISGKNYPSEEGHFSHFPTQEPIFAYRQKCLKMQENAVSKSLG